MIGKNTILLIGYLVLAGCSVDSDTAGENAGRFEPPPLPRNLPLHNTPSPEEIRENAILECKKSGGSWERYGVKNDMEYCLTTEKKALKEKCLKNAGEWRPKYGVFHANEPICVNRYPDKGKQCQSDNDCLSKFCRANGGSLEHGTCSSIDPFVCDRENFGFESYKESVQSGREHNFLGCME